MKTTKLLALVGVTTFGIAVLAPIGAHAESKSSQAKVEFIESDQPEIVDPEIEEPETVDPEKPLPPTIEENGVKVVYYPTLDFGTHLVTTAAAKYDAVIRTDESWTNEVTSTKRYLPAFIQVQNEAAVKGWTVNATLGEFVAGSNKLNGAVVDFGSVTAVNQVGTAATAPTSISLTAGSTAPQSIASYTQDASYSGLSINSVNFGSVSDTTNNLPSLVDVDKEDTTVKYNQDVTLSLPAGSGMKANLEYMADLEWTLAATL